MLSHRSIDWLGGVGLASALQFRPPCGRRYVLVTDGPTGLGRDDARHLPVINRLGRWRETDLGVERWGGLEVGDADFGRVRTADPRRRAFAKAVGDQAVLPDRGLVQQ